jgi:branched-chain amino acid transport system substrate-binding protein
VLFRRVALDGSLGNKRIRVVKLDDQFKVPMAVANARQLIDRDEACALLGAFGVELIAALRPVLDESGTPALVAFSRLQRLRVPQHSDCMFFPTASYELEVRRIGEQLATIGVSRIAIGHIDNEFGSTLAAYMSQVASASKLDVVAKVLIRTDGSNLAGAVKDITSSQPQALVIFAQTALIDSVFRQPGQPLGALPVYTVSFANPTGLASVVRDLHAQVVVSQVVPNPASRKSALANQFRIDWAAVHGQEMPTSAALEGYIAALILVQAIRRSPSASHRELHNILTDASGFRVGELSYTFADRTRPGNPYVEMSLVRGDGSLVS